MQTHFVFDLSSSNEYIADFRSINEMKLGLISNCPIKNCLLKLI